MTQQNNTAPMGAEQAVKMLREALQFFIDRCDSGTAKSRTTYEKFKDVLAATERAAIPEAKAEQDKRTLDQQWRLDALAARSPVAAPDSSGAEKAGGLPEGGELLTPAQRLAIETAIRKAFPEEPLSHYVYTQIAWNTEQACYVAAQRPAASGSVDRAPAPDAEAIRSAAPVKPWNERMGVKVGQLVYPGEAFPFMKEEILEWRALSQSSPAVKSAEPTGGAA